MVEPVQNSGDIKHPKRKSASDFPNTPKKIRGIFLPLRFFKIVINDTNKPCYINAIGLY